METAIVHQEQTPQEENISFNAAKQFFESQGQTTQKAVNESLPHPVPVSAGVPDNQHHSSSKSSSSSSSEDKKEDFVLSENDIYHAVMNDDIDRAREILVHHPHIKNDFGEKDMTPLHFAAAHGKLRMLRFLATSGSDYNMETMTGYTAMHLAAMHGHIECLKLLKNRGVRIESQNIEGQTPLHLSTVSGQLDSVKWLVINGADYTAKDNSGRSVIALAKLNHHRNIVEFIIAYRRRMNPGYSPSSSSSSSSSSGSSSSESEDEKQPEVRTPRVSVVQREQEDLEAKKRMYDEHQHQVKKRRISFLDEIRMEAENEENEGF